MIKTSATGEISNSSCDARKKIRASMGFTLLELMIVLTIMTLLVAATPAALNRVLPAYRLRTAAEQLLADLRMARVQAQAQGRVFVVACKESAYVVQSQGDASQRTVSLSSKTILTCRSSNSGQPVDRFYLFPDGSASGGVITVSDGKHEAIVALSALTGTARRMG